MTTVVRCRGLSVHHGAVAAIDRVDVDVHAGETVAVLGPSGSGKSSLLSAIAGFVRPTAGTIELGGRVVSEGRVFEPPEARPIGFVFQSYALWPHMNALETVAYPLRRAGASRDAASAEARRLLRSVGVSELEGRKPAQMSGGQQQRVGLARALARRADVFLFDEPTAHLDATVRLRIQDEISDRRRATGAAAMYATHDAGEALAIADRILILRQGRVVQVGDPREIYEEPADIWAARLTGPASVFEADVTKNGNHHSTVRVSGQQITLDDASRLPRAGSAMVLVRPEWVRLGGPISGTVEEVWYRGSHTDVRVSTDDGMLVARLPGAPSVQRGVSTTWSIDRAFSMGPSNAP